MSTAIQPAVIDLRREITARLSTVELRCPQGHPITLYAPEATPLTVIRGMQAPCPLCGAPAQIDHVVLPDARTRMRIRPR